MNTRNFATGRRRRKKQEFLIIGMGRFGASLARQLLESGYDVLAIDSDFRMVEQRSTDIPNIVQLDSTNIEALREIGADSFDTAIVCIGTNFEANIMTTVSLRKLGVRYVIAKVRTRTQKEIMLRIGADEVILPEHEAGVRLARRIAGNFVDYLEIGPDMCLVEMIAPTRFVGHTLMEAELRRKYGLTILAIRRGDGVISNPPAETKIEQDDELLVVGTFEDAERLAGQ